MSGVAVSAWPLREPVYGCQSILVLWAVAVESGVDSVLKMAHYDGTKDHLSTSLANNSIKECSIFTLFSSSTRLLV